MLRNRSLVGYCGQLALAGGLLASCSENRPGSRPPLPEEIPRFETIGGGKSVIGLELSPAKQGRNVDAFKITKHPITVKHYRQCVSAGACDAPALSSPECRAVTDPSHLNGSTFNVQAADDLPVTCVKPEQAIEYCRWVGSKLPDSSQWLVAARGPEVRRYAWGNTLSECEQHPEARLSRRMCDVSSTDRIRVGAHSASASPTGIEDVLLTPAELVATSADAFFSACSKGASACLVKGLNPGAIDGFGPIESSEGVKAEAIPANPVYGFRCASETK